MAAIGWVIVFVFFGMPLISIVVGCIMTALYDKIRDNKASEIEEYCKRFKRNFEIEERDLLENNIKEKFSEMSFAEFEYKIFDITEIIEDEFNREKYVNVKTKAYFNRKFFFKKIAPLDIKLKIKMKIEQ